jgi:hypothetical protein
MYEINTQQNFAVSNGDYYPNGTTFVVDQPFNVEFRWKNIKSKITLENGEDLIKISMLLSELLSANGIKNKLDISSEIL